tara:strand:- start:3825 stop:4625 length:801 start_codon:yes stop_codon:yes gene_type:complete
MVNNDKLSKALRENLLRRKEYTKAVKNNGVDMKKLYEGKAKIIYQAENENQVVQYFKDDATAFNNVKKDVIPNKGILNNYICEYIMQKLAENHIPNHFIKRIDDRNQLVKKLRIIPLEVIIRNYAAGSLSKRLDIEEGVHFEQPIFELCYKNDDLGDPIINDDHAVYVLQTVSENILQLIKEQSHKVNKVLTDIFSQIDIKLVDFKIEFGIDENENVVLADEISPDSCRLWDVNTNQKLDKDVFRRDLGDLESAYKEIADRLNIKI